jgi:PAS domain S-box-containing protein
MLQLRELIVVADDATTEIALGPAAHTLRWPHAAAKNALRAVAETMVTAAMRLSSASKLVHDRESDRFRLLVETVVDYAIFMLDTEGRISSWNSGAEAIKGYTTDEVLGRHFSIFYPPEAMASGWPEEELRRAREHGRFEDEGWRVRKDGTRFWANVVITAMYTSEGELSGYAKVTRDLTERRRHEEALRLSEERFRLLVESVRDYAIFMLDPTGVVQSWNSGAELITGFAAGDAIGRHFGLFYTPEDKQAHQPQIELETALAQGRVETEGWRVRKDGSVFWANVVISPVFDADDTLRGFAKVTRDMTDRRRLAELEESGARMNEFLAMLAHELRNPLAPIRNAVTLMQLEPVQSPVIRNSRDVIDRQLSHMTRLVDDLLDVGRMSTGKIRLRKERVLYNQLVARALEAVRPTMEARRHRLSSSVPPTNIMVEADPTRLSQVLQNLLINAAKFTPEGGDIRVEVRFEGARLITTVQDNGIGLAPQMRAQIFELFSQGEGAARESGLGIGLTLARSLVEMHGGTLTAESPGPGRGSTFTFFLPGAQTHSRDAAESMLRCLIVDDNRDAADSMAQLVGLMGSEVKVAYDSRTAIKLAAEFMPHVVLLDLGMPDMDGFATIERLRELEGGPQMRIAAVTGYGNEDDRRRTTAAGFDVHLTKPVDFGLLESFLARAKSRSGVAT